MKGKSERERDICRCREKKKIRRRGDITQRQIDKEINEKEIDRERNIIIAKRYIYRKRKKNK